MILIADGGSTKVDWRLVDNGNEVKQILTIGMNPFFLPDTDIDNEIKTVLLPGIEGNAIDSIHFFGAGCTPSKKKIVKKILEANFVGSIIEVESDLLAAAKGLCNHEEGVACILGTGSNSCHYDGMEIVDHTPPLGYILGDEGSGAILGKAFLNACLKNLLPYNIKREFFAKYGLDVTYILDRVYKEPLANRFLASFSPFIHRYLANEIVYSIVYTAFKDFFVKNVWQYDYDFENLPVHFTGSVAYYYKEVLERVASDMGISIGTVVQSPMEGLIRYYKS